MAADRGLRGAAACVPGRGERNPLVTIVSLLVGAELLGILGVLLAIPTAAAIQIIIRDWWSEKGLHVPNPGTDGRPADEVPTH